MNVTALKDGGYAVVYGANSINPDGSGRLGDIFVKAIHGDGSEGQPIRVNARAPIDGGGANQDTVVYLGDGGRPSVRRLARQTFGNGLISSVIVDTRTMQSPWPERATTTSMSAPISVATISTAQAATTC